MKPLISIAFLAVLSVSGYSPSIEWTPKEFPVSFWCGPPVTFSTPDRYKQIAAAGFNYVMPACEGPFSPESNRKVLDGCKAAGIKAFVFDERFPTSISGVSDAKKRLDEIVTSYAMHPALAGYFVTDEPSVDKFAGLAEVVEYLRKRDPAHPAYINLYPNNAGPARFGPVSYDAYVKGFIETVKPFAVSYDHYHFLKDGGDQDDYFDNLETVRALAEANGLPFWQIVQAIPHLKYRQPTEAEKRYDAMQTMAYGGQGLMFFTYWTPPGKDFEGADGIIKRDGSPSVQYDEVKRVNADVRVIGKYLLGAVRVATFQHGTISPGGKQRVQGTPVSFEGAGDLTAGIFRADTHLYVLIANRDYRKGTRAEAHLSTAGRPVEQLDKKSARWRLVKSSPTLAGDLKVEVSLAPGDGELYRW